jgi:hypothetical protein
VGDILTKRRISHREAHEIMDRFNCSHFRGHRDLGECARYSIPADPERDDDLLMAAYISQQEARDVQPRVGHVKTERRHREAAWLLLGGARERDELWISGERRDACGAPFTTRIEYVAETIAEAEQRALAPFVALVEAHAIEGDYSEGNEPSAVLGQVIARLQAAVLAERESAEKRGYERGTAERDDALRELACDLGVGGYNAPDPIDVDEFVRKIKDGTDDFGRVENKRGYERGVAEEREDVVAAGKDMEVMLMADGDWDDSATVGAFWRQIEGSKHVGARKKKRVTAHPAETEARHQSFRGHVGGRPGGDRPGKG